ncbi:ABC-three component system protein [Bradyrhizobium guangdongense]
MSGFPSTPAEAAAQAAGYYYQIRFGLYRALKRLLRDPTGSIAIERIDDIAISTAQPSSQSLTVAEIDQLKHTSNPSVTFTDNSTAIWRTIGNWIRLSSLDADIALGLPDLVLVTNASVQPGSGISHLGPSEEDRDPAVAMTKLIAAAETSENKTSAKDRSDFLSLEAPIRFALVKAIRIVPGAPGLAALASEIEDLLHYACEISQLSDFRSELEGWWFDRLSDVLATGIGVVVPLLEIDARVSYLREKYKTSNLQIDVEESADQADSLGDYLFVKQVRAVKVGQQRLRNAQRDFLKASAQRSKWLRESRIDPAELDRYDRTLEEQWSTKAAILSDELPSPCTEDDKCKCGRATLGWAETQQTPLKGATAQFLTSGSYHALADRLRVGWHPEFKELFEVG